MTQNNDALVGRLRAIHASVACDVMDAMGLCNQSLHHGIKPLAASMKLCGPAYTARGMSSTDAGKPTTSSYDIYRQLEPGDVLLIDTGGHEVAGPWGENTSLSAQMRGAAGTVIDGGTRDHAQVEAMGYPVFARFVTPVIAKGRWSMVAIDEPIYMSGQVAAQVRVDPDDFVLGDRDGVVIIPAIHVWSVLEAAEELERIELKIQAALRDGEDREAVYRRFPKFAHIHPLPGQPR